MSNDSINFADLWNKQTAVEPNSANINQKISRLKNKSIIRLFSITLLLGVTSAFIIWIWVSYNPKMVTTKTGIILILLAMAIFSLVYHKQYPILKKLDTAENNRDYLNNLIRLKKSEEFMQTTLLNIYFMMLSTGLLLYLIEPTQIMEISSVILTYTATISWILFAWFYLRPKQIKKQQTRINEIIQKIERISEDITDS